MAELYGMMVLGSVPLTVTFPTLPMTAEMAPVPVLGPTQERVMGTVESAPAPTIRVTVPLKRGFDTFQEYMGP
jgi:hypothetical protein